MKRVVFIPILAVLLIFASNAANAWENAYYKFVNSIFPVASKIASHLVVFGKILILVLLIVMRVLGKELFCVTLRLLTLL